MEIVQRFAPNTMGRDFVLGDIHGCFGQLSQALERVGFDPSADRCFSVGDLVDRGPDSPAALNWLEFPWFHACLGNHDEMALSAAQGTADLLWWVTLNGGAWWLRATQTTRQRFRTALAALPLVLELETEYGCIGIVHADVPAGQSWPEFLRALERDDSDARQTALWGRARADGLSREPVAGIERVVCGHTITPDHRIHVVGNVWMIDTGAFLPDGHLTLLPVARLFGEPAADTTV
ncbi:MAG: metallophosphoesterase [Gammaproteobacteria bacterium]